MINKIDLICVETKISSIKSIHEPMKQFLGKLINDRLGSSTCTYTNNTKYV